MKITITGYCGEGKTSIALLVADTLKAAGFQVKLDDIDVELAHGCEYRDLQEMRLVHLAKRNEPITVETVQLPRKRV